jgi:molybdate transport system permease protein
VVLPMVGPQLVAGAVLAWARALGEFGATITFAGNLQGRTQTVPLAVFQLTQTDQKGAIVLSLVLVVLSIAVLVALRGRITGAS